MRWTVEDLPIETEQGEIVIRAAECGGIYTRHISLPPGVDFTPLFVGLPDDRCQSAHWGVILEGSIIVRYADGREETNQAGDVYYWPGGHTGFTHEGVVFLEMSPTDDIMPVLDHVSKQLAAS